MRTLLLLGLLSCAACAPLPMGTAERPIDVPSPNFNERRPNYIVLHQTSNDNAARALRTLTSPERAVSAHYLIGRDGVIYRLVDENRRAWHAGESYWGGHADLNSASIGIELDNNGAEPFPEDQIAALLDLLRAVQARHKIPPANVIGHGDIAPGRKVDPSALFPWRKLAEAGFGLWCREPSIRSEPLPDMRLGLQALGYDVSDLPAALAAFRRHFLGDDLGVDLSPDETAVLQCLIDDKSRRWRDGTR
ncbi:MAG: N-acetylmuramoyl-L-alanine amidase [Pseudomonadota bacterium]